MSTEPHPQGSPEREPAHSPIARREFLRVSAASVGALGSLGLTEAAQANASTPQLSAPKQSGKPGAHPPRLFNGPYSGEELNRVAFPLGGLGAGMICLEGTGALSHFSLRNRPEIFNEPLVFAALAIAGQPQHARVLEGPVPAWKIFGGPSSGGGVGGPSSGLPRFQRAEFESRFPFGKVTLHDQRLPLNVSLTGWSPFEPGDADNSSLPVAGLEYSFHNSSRAPVEAVFSFNARNFMALGDDAAVRPCEGGFILWSGQASGRTADEGAFCAAVSEPAAKVNHAWFRGGWFDALTLAWQEVASAACFDRPPLTEGSASPGATLFVPFSLAPGQSRTITLRLAWFSGRTNLRVGKDLAGSLSKADEAGAYRPWYAARFTDINSVSFYWRDHYEKLRANSRRFSDCFYDTTLPSEVVEAVAANLTILKSPTVLRQADGKLWGWEGCKDSSGCCAGSCTHVWNYAQALPHLFPALERTLRETEFGASQNEAGHQNFRSALPIRSVEHRGDAAADGQLGGILKVFREWRISGDTEWLRGLWPKIKTSLNFCIETWDPSHKGVIEEPHQNTYDILFWGADGMCTGFYLGALRAAVLMGEALADEVPLYRELLPKAARSMEETLFNGEFFIQRTEWHNLRAKDSSESDSGPATPEARALFQREGPKYQCGPGCLSDGVLGAWLAEVCGVGQVLPPQRTASHLQSVYKYNFKRDLSEHANPQRPGFAVGTEGGLLLCTWPQGGAPSLPFVYSNEVWTGIEYQVASHLILHGFAKQGLEIVRACRSRYDGRVRNPFDEYECGHWYARAMSSYALLQALSGARYDALEKTLYLEPRIKGSFRCFLSTASGYGTVGVKNGKPFYEPKSGRLEIRQLKYSPAA